MKIRINAIITTNSPLHIASAGSGRYDPATQSFCYQGGFPCTRVQEMKIASDGETDDNGNYVAKINRVPLIAANNLAGRLRRHAAKLFLAALRGKGQTVNINTYSALMCGAVTGAPDKREMTYEEFNTFSAHPYVGLFGGGPRMLPRNVRIHDAVPITHATSVLAGNTGHPHAEGYAQDGISMTNVLMFRRNDDIKELIDVDTQSSSITDYEEAFNARQSVIIAEKASKKAGETSEGAKSSTETFSAMEIVVPNINFSSVFELDVDNLAQVGLFLASLDSFAQTERLGGQSRNGFGRFTLNDVIITTEEGEQIDSIFNNGDMNKENDLVKTCLDAWYKAAEQVDSTEIDDIYFVPEKKKPAAKKKASKE